VDEAVTFRPLPGGDRLAEQRAHRGSRVAQGDAPAGRRAARSLTKGRQRMAWIDAQGG